MVKQLQALGGTATSTDTAFSLLVKQVQALGGTINSNDTVFSLLVKELQALGGTVSSNDTVFSLLAKQVQALAGAVNPSDTEFSLEAKLAGSIGPVAPPGSNFNVGPTAQGTSNGSFSGITGVQVVNPKSGVLKSFSTYLTSGTSGINLIMGLYTDAANLPGTLIAGTSTAVVPTINAGLQTVPVANGPTIPAGTYWVAWQNQAPINGTYNNGVGLGAWNNGTTWTGALPASFSSAGNGAFQFVGYATLFG
jgi:hypothetical protein